MVKNNKIFNNLKKKIDNSFNNRNDNIKKLNFYTENFIDPKKWIENTLSKTKTFDKKYLIDHLSINYFVALPMFLLNIIFISIILNYLRNVDKCTCYNEENNPNINIKYLIAIETLLIIINVIAFLYCSYSLYSIKNIQNGGGMFRNQTLNIIYTVVYTILYSIFVYYVYNYAKKVDINCSCTYNWIRYLLYIQSFFMLFSIFFLIISLFLE